MAETTKSGPTVLVLEDDQAISELIRQVLVGDLHVQVEVARSGQEAFDTAFLSDKQIALVILDLGLLEVSGEDVIRQLHAHGMRPPILVVSAASPKVLGDAAQRVRAYATLPKPFDVHELIEKVRLGIGATLSAKPRRIPVRKIDGSGGDSCRPAVELVRPKGRQPQGDRERSLRSTQETDLPRSRPVAESE